MAESDPDYDKVSRESTEVQSVDEDEETPVLDRNGDSHDSPSENDAEKEFGLSSRSSMSGRLSYMSSQAIAASRKAEIGNIRWYDPVTSLFVIFSSCFFILFAFNIKIHMPQVYRWLGPGIWYTSAAFLTIYPFHVMESQIYSNWQVGVLTAVFGTLCTVFEQLVVVIVNNHANEKWCDCSADGVCVAKNATLYGNLTVYGKQVTDEFCENNLSSVAVNFASSMGLIFFSIVTYYIIPQMFRNRLKEEIKNQPARLLTDMDDDGNLEIDREEFMGWFNDDANKKKVARLKRSLQKPMGEVDQTPEAMFEFLDKDNSGTIDLEELEDALTTLSSRKIKKTRRFTYYTREATDALDDATTKVAQSTVGAVTDVLTDVKDTAVQLVDDALEQGKQTAKAVESAVKAPKKAGQNVTDMMKRKLSLAQREIEALKTNLVEKAAYGFVAWTIFLHIVTNLLDLNTDRDSDPYWIMGFVIAAAPLMFLVQLVMNVVQAGSISQHFSFPHIVFYCVVCLSLPRYLPCIMDLYDYFVSRLLSFCSDIDLDHVNIFDTGDHGFLEVGLCSFIDLVQLGFWVAVIAPSILLTKMTTGKMSCKYGFQIFVFVVQYFEWAYMYSWTLSSPDLNDPILYIKLLVLRTYYVLRDTGMWMNKAMGIARFFIKCVNNLPGLKKYQLLTSVEGLGAPPEGIEKIAQTQMQIKLSSQYNVAELAAIASVLTATLVAYRHNNSEKFADQEPVGFYDTTGIERGSEFGPFFVKFFIKNAIFVIAKFSTYAVNSYIFTKRINQMKENEMKDVEDQFEAYLATKFPNGVPDDHFDSQKHKEEEMTAWAMIELREIDVAHHPRALKEFALGEAFDYGRITRRNVRRNFPFFIVVILYCNLRILNDTTCPLIQSMYDNTCVRGAYDL